VIPVRYELNLYMLCRRKYYYYVCIFPNSFLRSNFVAKIISLISHVMGSFRVGKQREVAPVCILVDFVKRRVPARHEVLDQIPVSVGGLEN
jgi:hypothetical protein